MPHTNLTLKKLPKICKIWPKWRNFAKSGHTERVVNDDLSLMTG